MKALNFILLFSLVVYIHGKTVKHPISPNEPTKSKKTVKPVDVVKLPMTPSQQLDLAFILDTTGSMSSYINSARRNIRDIVETIIADSKKGNSQTDVRLALIEYRDHPLEESSFVTNFHDFTESDHVKNMKSWLDKAQARGGGDGPEAVAQALYESTKLSWRPESAKISVLISDAPPHGLVPREDSSYPKGNPHNHDPMKIVSELAQMGVTLYVIGCEPAILRYKDFFMAIAYKTGGQYVPMAGSKLLRNAIIGGAEEELSLQKFQKDVQKAFQTAATSGKSVDKKKITADLLTKFRSSGAKAKQLVINNKQLEGPSKTAKLMAASESLKEVSTILANKTPERKPLGGKRRISSSFGPFRGMSSISDRRFSPFSKASSFRSESFARFEPELFASDPISKGHSRSSTSDKISTLETGITAEQVDRLVQKASSKFSVI